VTPIETCFTILCEAIFNTHPAVFRSALVGVGNGETRRALICIELEEKQKSSPADRLVSELKELGQQYPITKNIGDFLIHPEFPVDIRHNAKIFREKLAVWAEEQLR
jgi:acyl-coenzyme A synthetase/AMP-(fatty) acid ligase